ncbi:uncharacterized protein Z518_00717 [Rhinocladiella mackenziei CBS 650.93]|uniref:Mid2 domain-containing protein n=1 Tax=Rhinocladiella mackenziei CBS 650.93 TaxID=1442369 RepID=A0A0D2J1R9_9EURO|nr:uncharacterized protein Z518_00717 [Rhinocladiella mackenziei CBS 650.93]KIX09636.1 hypothetical protein Z518_00717 [Rhinocladiella mackenziei CBS 650.93]
MKLLNLINVVSWCALNARIAHALSNVTFYSDDQCTEVISEKNGPDDGTCTPFPTIALSFLSFRVTSLDQTCAVTVYGTDPPFCSSDLKFIAPFSDCMTNTTVNQFSVDCQDYSVATASAPAIAPTATAAPSTDEGLSTGAKAGIGIGAAVGGLVFIALLVFFVMRNNKRKKREMEAGRVEADSKPAVPPYSTELPPDEKKVPVELPPQAMIPVEAPGDRHWPPPQELEGDRTVQSEMEGSLPTSKEDVKQDVKAENDYDVKKTPNADP